MFGRDASAPLKGSPIPPVPATAQPLKLPHNCWTGFAGNPGSSIINRASEPPALLRIRLVILVPRNTVMLACGIVWPIGVGVPPAQFRTISPINSVKPSARRYPGTELIVRQLKGTPLTWASPDTLPIVRLKATNVRTDLNLVIERAHLFGRESLSGIRSRDSL